MPQPFDLQKALAGAKLVTRDGREVTHFGRRRETDELCGYLVEGLDIDFLFNPLIDREKLFMADAEPLKVGDWIPCIRNWRPPYCKHSFLEGKFYKITYVGAHTPVITLDAELNIGTAATSEALANFDVSRKQDFQPSNGILDRVTKEPSILEQATALIYGDRQAGYGSVTTNFANIAKGWSVIFGKEVTPEQVGLAMAWVKIARQANKQKRDNLVDIAGYIGCIDKLSKGE